MGKKEQRGASDERTRRRPGGGESLGTETFTSTESTRADRKKSAPGSALPSTGTSVDTETSGQRISGPGPNDLTRGLP